MPYKDPEKRKAMAALYSKRWIEKYPERREEVVAIYRAKGGQRKASAKYRTTHPNLQQKLLDQLAPRPCPPLCEACGNPPNGHGRLHFDHDHTCCPGTARKSCGQCFRGWICATCNISLGLAKESTVILSKQIDYLRRTAAA